MTTINKNYEIDNIQILGDLDLLLKIRHQELLNGAVFSIFSDDPWAPWISAYESQHERVDVRKDDFVRTKISSTAKFYYPRCCVPTRALLFN